MEILKNKKIILGITGGIAAYKIPEMIRLFRKAGADVTVILTEAGEKFVSPLVCEILSENPCLTDMFATIKDQRIAHTSEGCGADLIVVAPATANSISKIACGIADNLLLTTITASDCPVLVAPSMHAKMYLNPILQENIRKLESLGRYRFVEPETGELAGGDTGQGRLPPVEEIFETALGMLTLKCLKGRKVLVTAGPTREHIDPVRVITNPSSGKMGFAIAKVAKRMGACVTLVSGPVALKKPCADEYIRVETAEEMLKAVEEKIREDSPDILLMAAAVADEQVAAPAKEKIKKGEFKRSLELKPAPDILLSVKDLMKGKIVVGFAAETENVIENARRKMAEKGLTLIFANQVGSDAGFAKDTNSGYLIDSHGTTFKVEEMHKEDAAMFILEKAAHLLNGQDAGK